MNSIAIVGGGLGGISAFSQLVKINKVAHYTIYEPASIAYGSSLNSFSSEHLCNTSILVNSLFKDMPDDFLNYIKKQGIPAAKEDFVPRFILLQYARETFTTSMKKALDAGSTVNVVKNKICSFSILPDGGCILRDDLAGEFYHHFAFFSPGPNLKVKELKALTHDEDLVIYSTSDTLERFSSNKECVAVLGSKLSAIDSALSLCRKGIKVTLYSPSGKLPSVRTTLIHNSDIDKALLKNIEVTSKRGFIKAINDNTQRIKDKGYRSINSPHQQLLNDIQQINAGEATWQYSIASIIDYANMHLSAASDTIKNSVIKRTKPLVSRYISSFPLENALKINQFIESSVLSVKTGDLKNFNINGKSVINLKDQAIFDGLIIATGIGNFSICKAGDEYKITETSNVIKEITIEDFDILKKSGVWFSGSLSHSIYPIVNYLKFCVDQAFLFTQTVEGI